MFHRVITLMLCCLLLPISFPVTAQPYPSKPLRIIVPYSPGSASDIISRIVAKSLEENIGKSVVIDNRPGANSIIGLELAAKAVPDGYTLVISPAPMISSLYNKLPYDPIDDFAPITQIGYTGHVLIANKNLAANSVKELVALAKTSPKKLNIGVPTISARLTTEFLKLTTGADLVLVPYKAQAAGVIDIMGGHLDLQFEPIPAALPYIKAGQVKALAVATPQRSGVMSGVPTVAESGYPDFGVSVWLGFFTRAGTPPEIVAQLNREIVRVLQNPTVKEQLRVQGFAVRTTSPEQLGEMMRMDAARWIEVVRKAGIPKID